MRQVCVRAQNVYWPWREHVCTAMHTKIPKDECKFREMIKFSFRQLNAVKKVVLSPSPLLQSRVTTHVQNTTKCSNFIYVTVNWRAQVRASTDATAQRAAGLPDASANPCNSKCHNSLGLGLISDEIYYMCCEVKTMHFLKLSVIITLIFPHQNPHPPIDTVVHCEHKSIYVSWVMESYVIRPVWLQFSSWNCAVTTCANKVIFWLSWLTSPLMSAIVY